MSCHLLIIDLNICATGVLFIKSSILDCSHFSFIKFSESGFMSRPLIHLYFSFVQRDENGSIMFLLHVSIQFYQHHFWRCCGLFCVYFVFFIKKKKTVKIFLSFQNFQFGEVQIFKVCPYDSLIILGICCYVPFHFWLF